MSGLNAVRGAALGLACLIAGCTNAPDRQVTAGSIGKSITTSIFRGNTATAAPTAELIAADAARALSATDAPLILLTVPERKAVTVMQQLERNGGHETYGTADRRSVTLFGGMLTGTRGLGNDLMSSDIRSVHALVSARRAGTSQRIMRHLDGEDLTVVTVSTCTVRIGAASRMQIGGIDARTTKVSETCEGTGADFTNVYHVATDGRILRSRQWHSLLVNYLTIQTLR